MQNFHPPNNYGSLAAAVFARTTALSFLGDFCVLASVLHPPSMGISCPLYCHALVFLRVRFFVPVFNHCRGPPELKFDFTQNQISKIRRNHKYSKKIVSIQSTRRIPMLLFTSLPTENNRSLLVQTSPPRRSSWLSKHGRTRICTPKTSVMCWPVFVKFPLMIFRKRQFPYRLQMLLWNISISEQFNAARLPKWLFSSKTS